MFHANCLGVHKCSLTINNNYLVKSMIKIVECSFNVGGQTREGKCWFCL
jgi:hypothetical protein